MNPAAETPQTKLERLTARVETLKTIADSSRQHDDHANLRTAQVVLKAHVILIKRLEATS
jgi:hypothetical protein